MRRAGGLGNTILQRIGWLAFVLAKFLRMITRLARPLLGLSKVIIVILGADAGRSMGWTGLDRLNRRRLIAIDDSRLELRELSYCWARSKLRAGSR